MSQKVRFSVVIPLYMGRETILQAINSALRQTYPPEEIIVVDDGSPDDSPEAVKEFARAQNPVSHPPIRLLRQENKGAAAARNCGIRHAAGNWVAFLDQDDRWHERKLELTAQALSRNEQCEWALTGFRLYVDGSCRGALSPNADVIARHWRYRNCFGPASCLAASKTALVSIGGFHEHLRTACEDWDLAIRLYRRYPLCIVADPLVEYYDSSASTSRQGLMMLEAEKTLLRDQLLDGLAGWRRWLERRLILACITARAARNLPGQPALRLAMALRSLSAYPLPSVAGKRVTLVLAALRDLLLQAVGQRRSK